jgi:hypothetical protein
VWNPPLEVRPRGGEHILAPEISPTGCHELAFSCHSITLTPLLIGLSTKKLPLVFIAPASEVCACNESGNVENKSAVVNILTILKEKPLMNMKTPFNNEWNGRT